MYCFLPWPSYRCFFAQFASEFQISEMIHRYKYKCYKNGTSYLACHTAFSIRSSARHFPVPAGAFFPLQGFLHLNLKNDLHLNDVLILILMQHVPKQNLNLNQKQGGPNRRTQLCQCWCLCGAAYFPCPCALLGHVGCWTFFPDKLGLGNRTTAWICPGGCLSDAPI